MFEMLPGFQAASEEALGSREGEGVKPAGGALRHGGVGSPTQLVRGLPDIPLYLCALEKTVLGPEPCAEQLCLGGGRAGHSTVHGNATLCLLPLVLQRLISSWAPECVSRFSKLLNLRYVGSFCPARPLCCPCSCG